MSTYTWVETKAKLKEAILALPHFLRNPVQGMRQLPDWDWHTLLILPPAFALACGTIKNIIDRDFIGLFTDILISPLASIVVISLTTGLFYYLFKFAFEKDLPFRAIYIHVVFAALPAQITNIATKFLPPINILGLAATMYLLHSGFVHNFNVDSNKLKKLFTAGFAVFVLWWAVQLFKVHYHSEGLRIKATPESLDILEKELNSNPTDNE